MSLDLLFETQSSVIRVPKLLEELLQNPIVYVDLQDDFFQLKIKIVLLLVVFILVLLTTIELLILLSTGDRIFDDN